MTSGGRLRAAATLAAALAAAAPGGAARAAIEVMNGGACVGYPPSGEMNQAGHGYQHWFYLFRENLFCHITHSDRLPANRLAYVVVSARAGRQPLGARLCLHSGDFP